MKAIKEIAAYTINGYQPVVCTLIGDSPICWVCYDEGEK